MQEGILRNVVDFDGPNEKGNETRVIKKIKGRGSHFPQKRRGGVGLAIFV